MKRIEKISLGTAIAAVLLVVAFFVIQSLSASRRQAALAAFTIPDRVADLRGKTPAAGDPIGAPNAEESSAASFERVTFALFGHQTDEWRMLMRRWREPRERQDDFWEKIERELAPAAPALADIRERAAQGGPLGKVTFDNTPNAYFNHVAFAHGVAETLEVDAHVAVRHDDVERAVADIMAIMQLADALADDPIQHSHYTRWSAYHRAIRSIEAISPDLLTPDQIERLIDHLAQADRREAFADSFAGDVLLKRPYFDQPDLLVEQHDDWAAYLGTNDPLHVLYNTPLGKPLLYSDEATYLDLTQQMADAATRPYYKALGEIAAISRKLHSLPTTRVLSRGFLLQAFSTLQQQAEHESRLDVAGLGLAIELYRQEHGACPGDLQSVAQYLPDGIPVDVFTGKPYVYRTNVNPFLLYGFGADGADQGGRAAQNYRERGDIVWRGALGQDP